MLSTILFITFAIISITAAPGASWDNDDVLKCSPDEAWVRENTHLLGRFSVRAATYQDSYLYFGFLNPKFTGPEFDLITREYHEIRGVLSISPFEHFCFSNELKEKMEMTLDNLEIALNLVEKEFYKRMILKLNQIRYFENLDPLDSIELNVMMDALGLYPDVLELIKRLGETPLTSEEAFQAMGLVDSDVSNATLKMVLGMLKTAYASFNSISTLEELRCCIGVYNGFEAVRIGNEWLREKSSYLVT
jgi:hypothetical protein